MIQPAVGDLRNMDQPVLMDADIDERAEINHIADRALQFHAGL